ncbi:hypothetical protein YB2330_002659 [Saitoella coloradoensis]
MSPLPSENSAAGINNGESSEPGPAGIRRAAPLPNLSGMMAFQRYYEPVPPAPASEPTTPSLAERRHFGERLALPPPTSHKKSHARHMSIASTASEGLTPPAERSDGLMELRQSLHAALDSSVPPSPAGSMYQDGYFSDVDIDREDANQVEAFKQAQRLVRQLDSGMGTGSSASTSRKSSIDLDLEAGDGATQPFADTYAPRRGRAPSVAMTLMSLGQNFGMGMHNVPESNAIPAESRRSTDDSGTMRPRRKWWQSRSANSSATSLQDLAGHAASINQSSSTLGGPLSASQTLVDDGTSSPKPSRPGFHSRISSQVVSGLSKMNIKKQQKARRTKAVRALTDYFQKRNFIIKLCRALMLYGAPTHRLEEYCYQTASMFTINASFLYLPGCMFCCFKDEAAMTSDIEFIRVPAGIDLWKLRQVHLIYKEVVHDELDVGQAAKRLEKIMKAPPLYNIYFILFFWGFASAWVGLFAFTGRWIDMPIAFALGIIVGFFQLVVASRVRNFTNIFEVLAAFVTSFLARLLGSIMINGEHVFCYANLAASSIALILPGYIVLTGALELQSRNIIAGSIRIIWALVYSLMLGYGSALGSVLSGVIGKYCIKETVHFSLITETTCTEHLVSPWFRFIIIPMFTLCLLIVNQAHPRQWLPTIIISSAGNAVGYFVGKVITESSISGAVAAFVVGVLGNIYSRVWQGLAFTAVLPAIFVMVPSGLSAQGGIVGGLQASESVTNGTTTTSVSYDNVGWDLGVNMIQVAIGITVGLFLASLVTYPYGKKRSVAFAF